MRRPLDAVFYFNNLRDAADNLKKCGVAIDDTNTFFVQHYSIAAGQRLEEIIIELTAISDLIQECSNAKTDDELIELRRKLTGLFNKTTT